MKARFKPIGECQLKSLQKGDYFEYKNWMPGIRKIIEATSNNICYETPEGCILNAPINGINYHRLVTVYTIEGYENE